jgi:hypothetical protein
MTWGSNASYRPCVCRYCKKLVAIDDADDGENSHERQCASRTWWRRLLGFI